MDELDAQRLHEEANKLKSQNFSKIVNGIENLADEKKLLYREIYENAITDRQNAYMQFSILVGICNNGSSNSTEYAIHGKGISAFIDRMAKANDQLLKLSDLLRRAEERDNFIDPEEMFNQINRR